MPKKRPNVTIQSGQAARHVVRLNPHRSITTGHLSGLAHQPLAWESYLEQIASKLVSACHDVRQIATQPMVLPVSTAAGTRYYHPDLYVGLVRPDGAESLLVEVKPLEVLLSEPTLSRMLQVAEECLRQEIHFCILSDDQLYAGPFRQNALLLWRYRKGAMPPLPRVQRIKSALEGDGPMSIRDLLVATAVELVDIYTLIAKRELTFACDQLINRTLRVALPSQMKGMNYADIQAAGRYGDLVEAVAMGRRPPDWRIVEAKAIQRRPRPDADIFSAVGGFSGGAPLRDLREEESAPRSAWARGGLSFDQRLSPLVRDEEQQQ